MKLLKKNPLISSTFWVWLALTSLSTFAYFYYSSNGLNLLYGDALSRLNIARKIVDNLTPGIAQLGNVWLPMPQVLMLPFVWNNYLWHTGLAASIVSMASYIIGGFFIYKAARLVSPTFASFISLGIYALNVNILYLQTTAMSESFFLCAQAAFVYFFLAWVKTKRRFYLIPAALSVSCMTLIRYEALALLAATIPLVFLISIFTERKYKIAEANVVFYATLAMLGFGLWTLYLTAIFGDPLFWQHYYLAVHVKGDDKTQLHIFASHISFYEALWKYFTAIVWMNGIIPVALAILSIPLVIINSIRKRNLFFIPVFLPFVMFALMITTLQKNTPIDQPALTINAILTGQTSYFPEFNIRYGLLMLPMISLLIAYIAKSRIMGVIIIVLMSVQFYTYIKPDYTLIYQIPLTIASNNGQGTPKEKAAVNWLQHHYDRGLIMISALKHDPQMFQLGLDYKMYIHEGAGKYWKSSIEYPKKYATWILFDSWNPDDQVTRYLLNKPILEQAYDRVYDTEGMEIYRIKDMPDIDVTQEFHAADGSVLNILSPFKITNNDKWMSATQGVKIIGVNSYDLAYLNKKDIVQTVKKAKENGINTMRIWAFGEGIKEGFQPAFEKINNERFDNLAYALSVLHDYDMRAILTLSNYWKDYGGIQQYLAWDGMPNKTTQDLDVFFTHPYPKNRYRVYMEHVLEYESQYTQKKLKDDPTILAWELMNEPRSSSKENGQIVVNWLREMSERILRIDPNHMILAGTEGFTDLYNDGQVGPSFAEVLTIPSINAATVHYYPEHNVQKVPLSDLLQQWNMSAQQIGKPLVVEEIGFDKRKGKNDGQDRVQSVRDLFATTSSLDIDGVLLWNWALKRDDSYGISPLDPRDTELLTIVSTYAGAGL